MLKRRHITLFCLIFFMVIMVPATAFADLNDIDPYHQIFNDKLGEGFRDEQPLFMKYSAINYRLDYVNGNQASTSGAGSTFLLINTILSFCMVGMALAAKLTIDIMTWSFSYDQVDLLTSNIESVVDQLIDGLFFSELFAVGLFGLGVSLFFSFSKREDVAGKLLKVIFNLIIAFTLLSNMGFVIKYVNQISKWGSDAAFIAFESVLGTNVKEYDNHKGKNAFFNLSEKFFEYNVHIPWQLSEFGMYVPKDKVANLSNEERQLRERTDQTLSQEIGQDREENNPSGTTGLDPTKFTSRFDDNENNNNENAPISMTSFGIPFRIFVVWLTFTVGTLYGCLLLAIAGTAIICQFLLYLLALLSPLVFLLVLIPDWGNQVLIKWLQGIITSAVYKVIASLLLILILVLQGKIYDVTMGWAYAMFAQVVMVFAVFLFRKSLMEFIPLPGVAASQYTENTLFDKGKSIVDKTFGTVVDRAKVTVVGAPTVVATGNPSGFTSQRAAVNLIEQEESSKQTSRRGVFEVLGEMVQSKSLSRSDQKEGNIRAEQSQTSFRRRSQLSDTEISQTESSKQRSLRSGPEGFVRVGDVKEAIDRLANNQPIKNSEQTSIEEKFHARERKPVDVRVVEMTPSPQILEQITNQPVNNKRFESIEKEIIETNNRTVTPIVKEEKVEEIRSGKRKVPKLAFPEATEKRQEDKQKEENKNDSNQSLDEQSSKPEEKKKNNKPSVGKDQPEDKKGSWLGKMVDKFKS